MNSNKNQKWLKFNDQNANIRIQISVFGPSCEKHTLAVFEILDRLDYTETIKIIKISVKLVYKGVNLWGSGGLFFVVTPCRRNLEILSISMVNKFSHGFN